MPRAIASPRAPRYDSALALRELAAADPKLGRLIQRAGPFTLRVSGGQSPFEALVESIVYQQLHGKAAATIHRRLLESFGPTLAPNQVADILPIGTKAHREAVENGAKHPTPQQILDCPNEQLRAAGLSANKALALRDLAAKTLDGTVPTLAQIRRMSDDAVIEHLTQVRGIGVWTVHMFLMFALRRHDVLPTGDLGIRMAMKKAYALEELPKPAEMEKIAAAWHPWCSVASWYMWRSLENEGAM